MYYTKRQIELVEFSEMVYHNGLRHKAINGSLYEDKLIRYLRNDIKEFSFFKGQIKDNYSTSLQYDIIICRKETIQLDFLKNVNEVINIVDRKDCYGVIELKKWGNPKMLDENGKIKESYVIFKNKFPELKYFFVCLRFKDRKLNKNNWFSLETQLKTDGNFCFFGNVGNQEWKFPWNENQKLIEDNKHYFGEYKKLIDEIKNVAQQGV